MNATRGTAHPAVATYVSAVRDELGDLPPDELADIAEDVRDHLDEVAAEFGDGVSIGALIERLGAPAAYAAELRAAAGLAEPDPVPARPRFGRRLLRLMTAIFAAAAIGLAVLAVVDATFSLSGAPGMFAVPAAVALLIAGASALLLVLRGGNPADELRQIPGGQLMGRAERWMRAKPWGEPAIEFVASLRPAWWVARAAALGMVAAYFGNVPLGGVVFLSALVASVWLGRKTSSGQVRRRGLLAINAANVALAAGGVIVGVDIATDFSVPPYAYVEVTGAATDIGLYNDAGEPVTNIFAYGSDGALLQNVRLYDQDGHPLELGPYDECYEGAYPEETFTVPNPWGEHVFPRLSVAANEYGECLEPELQPPFGTQLPGETALK